MATKVFHRPLFNAGRWFNRYQGAPSIHNDALVEVSNGQNGIWRLIKPRLTNVRNYKVREVLPPGYTAFVKPTKPRVPPPQTAREVPASGRRLFTSRSHGGGCCGRVHLSDFPTIPTLATIAALKTQTPVRRCTEITLTYYQAKTKGWNGYTWDAVLKELGWKLVMCFNNGNSGNDVYVYLHSTTERAVS